MIVIIMILLFLTYLILDRLLRSLKVDKFTERYVFITGCDTGFGRELAIQLDRLGLHVFAGCLGEAGAKSLSEACSCRLTTVPLNVTQTDSIERALQIVKQKLPANKGIWALVNNAGILGNLSTFELCIKQDISQVLDVNLLGAFEVTRLCLPLIRKEKGRVVNITSMCGRFPLFGIPYCVSKFALEALSDMLRRDVYEHGIHVSILEPGGYSTSMTNVGVVKRDLKHNLEKASPEVHDLYEGALAKWEPTMEKVALITQNIQPVIDAYTHAVTSKFPRTRYVVGSDAKYLFIPLSFLPGRISDAFLRIGFKVVIELFK